jgi:hypothetical protein
MQIKLIALDMDGTTLNEQHQVSNITKDAIEQAIAQNVEVIISTGRTGIELKPIFDKFSNIRYFICGNGSKIYDREKNINVYENMLPFKESSTIMQQLVKYDVVPEVYANEQIYTDQYYYDHVDDYIDPTLKSLILRSRTPVENIHDFLLQHQKPIEKINIFYKDIESKNKIHKLCTNMQVTVTSSLDQNIEINSKTASKGTALQHLCQTLHIASTDVMAIGDASNDISMLKYAGFSVAMGNAIPEVKKISKFTTLTNIENGVAASIHEHILKN